MQNTFVIKIVSVVIFFVFGICYAEEVSVKKTFDYGNTLQYDLIYNHSNTRYILQYTTYRNGDGAHIRFDSEKRFSVLYFVKCDIIFVQFWSRKIPE